MADLFDYLDWRGDLTLEKSPFNEVDAAILSYISYVEYDKIVSKDFKAAIPLSKVYETYHLFQNDPKYNYIGRILKGSIIELFKKTATSERFREFTVSGYYNEVDEHMEGQFSALTFHYGDQHYVVYRGTDDSVVGWKEDFNMVYTDVIPSREYAKKYYDAVADCFSGKIFLMGHSKGGNIAIYAATCCTKEHQDRIHAVYNFDGPGFFEDFLLWDQYENINERTFWYLPSESIIGSVLSHGKLQYVLKSNARSLMQHDPLSWETKGTAFVREECLSKEAIIMHMAIERCINELTPDKRRLFIDVIFDSLAESETKTLTDFNYKSTLKLIDSVKNTDEETKSVLKEMFKLLLQTVREKR